MFDIREHTCCVAAVIFENSLSHLRERHWSRQVTVIVQCKKIKAGLTRELRGPTAAGKSPHVLWALMKSHGAAVPQPIGSV